MADKSCSRTEDPLKSRIRSVLCKVLTIYRNGSIRPSKKAIKGRVVGYFEVFVFLHHCFLATESIENFYGFMSKIFKTFDPYRVVFASLIRNYSSYYFKWQIKNYGSHQVA